MGNQRHNRGYRALLSIGLFGVIYSCRPTRPLVMHTADAHTYYFQDRRTGRSVAGPYLGHYRPPAGQPLPRHTLAEVWDSVQHTHWLVNAWGERTVRVFYYDTSPDRAKQGLFRYVDEQKQVGFANRRGQVKIPARFTIAFPFAHGRSIVGQGSHQEPLCPGDTEHPVWRGGQWGLINRRGRVLVPCQYDALNTVQGHPRRLEAVQGTQAFLINRNGKRLSPRPYQSYHSYPCDTTHTWGNDGWGPEN